MNVGTDVFAAAGGLTTVRRRVCQLPALSLAELQQSADLQDRVDTKFVVTPNVMSRVLDDLTEQINVLDIDGTREFRYESTYFDTPDLKTFRAHRQGRRRRFKVRTRTYVDSNLRVLEVKTKGVRGRTEKVRMTHSLPGHELDAEAREFIARWLTDYGIRQASQFAEALQPTLLTTYRRTTFVGCERPFRLTADVHMRCGNEAAAVATLHDRILLEAKTSGEGDPLIRLLHRHGARPVKMSKYCAGIAMLNDDIAAQPWNPVIRRHLRPLVA